MHSHPLRKLMPLKNPYGETGHHHHRPDLVDLVLLLLLLGVVLGVGVLHHLLWAFLRSQEASTVPPVTVIVIVICQAGWNEVVLALCPLKSTFPSLYG